MRLPDDSVFVLFIAFFIYAASNRLLQLNRLL